MVFLFTQLILLVCIRVDNSIGRIIHHFLHLLLLLYKKINF